MPIQRKMIDIKPRSKMKTNASIMKMKMRTGSKTTTNPSQRKVQERLIHPNSGLFKPQHSPLQRPPRKPG